MNKNEVNVNTDLKSKIVVYCKDGTKRIINCIGRYSEFHAVNLGRDLEYDNYHKAEVSIIG